MKKSSIGFATLAVLSVSAGTGFAQNLTLDFASLQNSDIVFGGAAHNFTFLNSTPLTPLGAGLQGPAGFAQWQITDESGSAATGSATVPGQPLLGNLDNGPFTYGMISGGPNGIYQSATVVGPAGLLDIADNFGGVLQGTVNFIDISTYGKVGGFLNDSVQVNLVNVTYNGGNPDLQFLNNNWPGGASVDLSFQFNPGMNLTQLSSGAGGYGTSYSGSISVTAVPEPSSLAMSALGGLGALGMGFRRCKKS